MPTEPLQVMQTPRSGRCLYTGPAYVVYDPESLAGALPLGQVSRVDSGVCARPAGVRSTLRGRALRVGFRATGRA